MLLLVVARVIFWARRRAMAHDTVFGNLITVMTLKTILHTPPDIMTIEVFPGGNAGVASAAFCLSMFFMGKAERLFVALPLALSMPGLFEVAQAAVGLFPRFEMTFEATFLTGTTKSVVNFRLLRKIIAGASLHHRCAP